MTFRILGGCSECGGHQGHHIERTRLVRVKCSKETPIMAVRAKFQVNSVKKSVGQDGQFMSTEVQMSPVYGKDGTENANWSKYTPSGNLVMHITNPAAADSFLPGQQYFIDFTLTTPAE